MTQPFKKFFYFLAISGLVLVNFIAQPVFAAQPEDVTVLLSDSRPSTVSDWTIDYDQGSGITFTDTNTLVITFPAGFSFGSVDDTDVDFSDNGSDRPVQSGACGATNTVRYERSSQVVTFTACNAYTETTAGSILQIKIGLNASGGDAQITNSTAATYTVTSDATQEDAKDALIAIVAGVNISASIDESLSVTVTGITAASGDCVDLGGSPTDVDTTPTAVTYGSISTEAFYTGCQKIAVDTNAGGGYSATVAQTQLLTSGGNTIAEGNCDGTCNDTTLGGWETATNNGFAYCADDITGNAAADAGIAAADQCDDATPSYYTFFTDPTEPTVSFMASAGPISDETNISYHLSVPGSQAAGTYTNTTYYVVTGTF